MKLRVPAASTILISTSISYPPLDIPPILLFSPWVSLTDLIQSGLNLGSDYLFTSQKKPISGSV